MPSTMIEVSVGATGAMYAAPANGYFVFSARTTAVNGYAGLAASYILVFQQSPTTNFLLQGFIPILKGNSVVLNYGNVSFETFRFVYAEGSK